MTVLQLETQVSSEQLLRALETMPLSELRRFAVQVDSILKKRQAPRLSQAEAELLLEINRGLPSSIRSRLDELLATHETGSLSDAEQRELVDLTNQLEEFDARRIQLIGEFSKVRNQSVAAVITQFQLSAAANGT
jgi:hypothetical protein